MNEEYINKDGKHFKLTEVKGNEVIISDLIDSIKEYESLKTDIYNLEQENIEKEREIASLEYQVNYDINIKEKENFSNEKQREAESKKRLNENEIYKDLVKARIYNNGVMRLKKSRLESLEYKSKIYRAIITEKRDY